MGVPSSNESSRGNAQAGPGLRIIRRQDQREILFDLERVRGSTPEGEARLLIDKTVGNLLRLWAEA